MRPLADFSLAARRDIRGVLCDIDDTLTTDGCLTAEAYAALERLQRARLLVFPITGRPAGWCDHIARMWPVDAVVGENGAFYFRYDRRSHRMQRRYVDAPQTRADHRQRFEAIAAEITGSVEGSAIASDQQYRETDLAIDFCEDVPRLPEAEVERIAAMMRARGLTAKVSSIHVNGWFGTYDKLTTTRVLMREAFDVELDRVRNQYVFVGDSPNDAPMFAYFPHSIGVGNISDFAGRIEHFPTYVTQSRCGEGFREAADCILAARQSSGPET